MSPGENGNRGWFSSPITSPLLGPPRLVKLMSFRVFQSTERKKNKTKQKTQLRCVIRPLRSGLKGFLYARFSLI